MPADAPVTRTVGRFTFAYYPAMARLLPLAGLLLAAAGLLTQAPARPGGAATGPAFSVVEATIADMRLAMEQGRSSSRELVQQSLARIVRYEPVLNAVLTLNPRALAEADQLDRERRAGRIRGPLHGIPIALKDNIQTTDMLTSGGALAFASLMPPYEATLTRNLRESGAVIVAKTVMTELANWVSPDMPNGYSSLGGYSMNPYDPRADPRAGIADGRPVLDPGGSSSGSGTAASLWAANVGTETSGSILSPANENMLAAIKPTVGRISRYGVIPITADQDTAGPMARSVADAAILLGALEGAAPDPHDAATTMCTPPPGHDYTRFLDREALRGARIGIPRAYYYDRLTLSGRPVPGGGLSDAERAVMAEAIAVLEAHGAVIVDPANVPSAMSSDAAANPVLWNICAGAAGAKGRDDHCSSVLKYGMKRDFNAWLASLGNRAPVTTLTALRAWNRAHAGAIRYGQGELDISDEVDLDADRARYLADRERDVRLAGRDGIDAALRQHQLDALLFAGVSGAALAARPGYPTVIVPFGTVPNRPTPPLPPGFNPAPAMLGVSFTAGACSEPRLIALAYAFEQATRRRVPPALGK
jgi:amidase